MLQDLFARTQGGIRYDLACMEALLAALGSPQRKLQVVLVAGTNGKGSTSKLVAQALQQAGHRCGLFTSPHLRRFAERIQVDGVEVGEVELAAAYAKLLAVEKRLPRPFTFFEATVAMACLHFVARGVRVAVFEAGLGGRLDATNVFGDADRLVCLLSRVDLDHQALLGDTRAAIAVEKAGLWRSQRPAIVAPQAPEVAAALAAYAEQHAVPVTFLAAHEPAELADLFHRGPFWPPFLRHNAALAWAACEALNKAGLKVGAAAFAAALAQFFWPGRYHWLHHPDARVPQVLLDGGHNPAGCAALAAALVEDPALRGRRVVALVGALGDKDLTAMVAALAPQLAEVALVATAGGRGRATQQLQTLFPHCAVFAGVDQGLTALLPALAATDVLLVTGSLVLVGEALTALYARHYFDAARAPTASPEGLC